MGKGEGEGRSTTTSVGMIAKERNITFFFRAARAQHTDSCWCSKRRRMCRNEHIAHSDVMLLLYATRALVEDCRRHVCSYLPMHTWSRCQCCGYALIMVNDHGDLFFSPYTRFSMTICDYCYWREI